MKRNKDFILQHRTDDPHDLALRQSRYPDVDMPYAVQQIAAWQTARRKLPLWAETDGVEFPVHLSMEQCSSQLTAEYKASIVTEGDSMTDLTAGFGVDATMMGRKFRHLNYVERNEALCEIAKNNLPLFGINDFTIWNSDAEEVLKTLPHQSLIFLDPARRDENGGKTVQISDCTPNVLHLQDALLERADTVLIKLSPMLDIPNIIRELTWVGEIHVVSVENECKEILVSPQPSPPPPEGGVAIRIVCVDLKKDGSKSIFTYNYEDERSAECHYYHPDGRHTPFGGRGARSGGSYLYEPNTSIMKAAGFKSVGQRYGIEKLHPSSHLYASDRFIADFPGRIFKVNAVHSLKDKALKSIRKANLTVRNFPASVSELRKRFKLSEGGSVYLFATTLADESKVIIECEKAK